jgi:hypothetical protein
MASHAATPNPGDPQPGHRRELDDPSEDTPKAAAFRTDLHCMENGSDTPDFILAAYLRNCLDNFDMTVRAREKWYSRQAGDGAAILHPRKAEDQRRAGLRSGSAPQA